MSLSIAEKEIEGVVILKLKGELTVGEGVSTLRSRLEQLVSQQKTRVVIDLEQVDYMDSTGLGSLVVCFTTLRKADGAMKLLHLNRRNVELLLLTKLVSVFEVYNDEREAVNSFFPDRQIEKFDILSFVEEQRKQDEQES